MNKSTTNLKLFKHLSKLNNMQFKIFYGLFVHYWAEYRYFISKQNFFNLRCELNNLCHAFDESFPDQYDDFYAMRSFSEAYPYYFIDKIPISIIARLFTEHIDDRIDILINIAKTLYETDIHTTYAYANKTLCLDEQVDVLVTEAQKHIKDFS